MIRLVDDHARVANCHTLADLLDYRAERDADAHAFRFLDSSGTEDEWMTYADLHARVTRLANHLAAELEPGDRVVILLPVNADYIISLFACQAAGVIGIPAYPPNPRRTDSRITGILTDCGASGVIAQESLKRQLLERPAEWPQASGLRWIVPGAEHDPVRPTPRVIRPQDYPFLQYTSGSTGEPRGVTLSHANVLCNLKAIRDALRMHHDDSMMGWVPPYHDMGLIGGILLPVFARTPCTVMAPSVFAQRPARWLEGMTSSRATISTAPNFAYELCVDRIPKEERTGFDLSAWRVACNGAEPVRADTLARFTEAFQPYGFRMSSFVPCYGLAELALFASGESRADAPPTIVEVDTKALSQGLITRTDGGTPLVCCGPPADDADIVVVDPATHVEVEAGRVGELWISSPSVAPGYWNQPGETARTFHARLAGDPRTFLRTGDLGGLIDGEVVITGRLKDVIILDGRNIFPQDIEAAAEQSHELIRRGGIAAFGVAEGARTRVVMVTEVNRAFEAGDRQSVEAAIRASVANELGLRVDEIVLIRQATLPRTSSGKVRRSTTRAQFEDHSLAYVEGHVHRIVPDVKNGTILSFLKRWLANEMQLPEGVIDPETGLRELGLDSLAATRLLVALEIHLGQRVDAATLWRSATIAEFADSIASPGEHSGNFSSPHRDVGPASTPPIEQWPEYRVLRQRLSLLEADGGTPFFQAHDDIAGATTRIRSQEFINFSHYNYLGLSGHPAVTAAARLAAEQYGTSVSASRIVSGERPIHAQLEHELADFLGQAGALVFVGGHATNVSVISHLFGPGDLVLCDALMHNSALQGAAFSGARWVTFRHNDAADCDAMLRELRANHRRAVIVIEGAYSADGDIPDLRAFVDLKRKYSAMLMVDEAHSLGVLGKAGRGIAEHSGVPSAEIDIMMGTLSKTLASCGGYIAGSEALVEYLKYTAPGFVYSVGITPPNAAAAAAALRVLATEPERVSKLQQNSEWFASAARRAGFNVGMSGSAAVVPVIVGDSLRAIRMCRTLMDSHISVLPMVSPSVPNDGARLRFFISSDHTRAHLQTAIDATSEALRMESSSRTSPLVQAP